MLKQRLIPCLLLSNGGLVKTMRFDRPKYVGDPINAIRIFNDKEVDELMVLDIMATRERRDPDYGLIEQLAGECFMPLCYGGGIRNVEQARQLFALGVEKISLQSAALEDPRLITLLAERFGSQSIVVSLDIKRNWLNQPKVYASARGKTLAGAWMDHLQTLVSSGAGEVLLNSVDRDGTQQGMDFELIEQASRAVSVPLIAVGGVGSMNDIKRAADLGASAIAAGAYFVFQGKHRAVLITYPRYDEIEKLLGSKI